jgi:ABC-2 type transport system ATP-binding protein
MLLARGLVKTYGGRRALDGFTLSVRPGEIAGLIGHNGAGKTTFVEVVTGLVRPEAGAVSVCGADALAAPRAARALLGVAPQELALYPTVTVREQLGLFAGLSGLRRAAAARSVREVAGELMLGEVLDRRCAVLSGGQRRRVQAAAAMVGSPAVLLLDEPTAGADPQTRSALLAAVRARAAAGAAVLYTTHYLPELVELDATLAVAERGRVVARGERAALTADLPGEVRVTLDPARPRPSLAPELQARVREDRAGELRVTTRDPSADLAALLAAGCAPLSVDVRSPDLDDLYAALAGGGHRPSVPHEDAFTGKGTAGAR